MFKTITAKIDRDRDYPQRQFDIDMLTRVLEGRLYDHLQYDFGQERKDGMGEYIPLRERRPSVRYALSRIVVDDSVSLLFSEGHFPTPACDDEATQDMLAEIIKEARLNEVMIEAATVGSVGSVAVLLRVLSNRVFFSVFNTQFLTPTWKADAPDTLAMVSEQYKVKGSVLAAAGYTIPTDKQSMEFWFRRDWTEAEETWYLPAELPVLATDAVQWVRDAGKSTAHQLGFVPMVWIKNLPGGTATDGRCTFPTETIDTQIEIDYQLSQAGRGLKYSSDPTLLLKEPAVDNDGRMVKGGGNALIVGKDGDAKLLEINGTAAQAVLEYVAGLREMALESAHGNRSNADKLSAAQSGRAMELMMQSLIWLADKLRISYGEGALLDLLRMVVAASGKFALVKKDGTPVGVLSADKPLSLRWPAWFAPTYADKQTQSLTLNTLCTTGLLSRETAVQSLASDYDIEDVQAELVLIHSDPMTPPPPADGKVNPDANDN